MALEVAIGEQDLILLQGAELSAEVGDRAMCGDKRYLQQVLFVGLIAFDLFELVFHLTKPQLLLNEGAADFLEPLGDDVLRTVKRDELLLLHVRLQFLFSFLKILA